MLKDIERQHRTISLEASTPSQALKAVTDRLPGFVSDVKEFVSDILSGSDQPGPQLTNTRKIKKALRDVNYTSLSPITVYVPDGLSVTYLEYVRVLEQGQDICDGLDENVLEPFNKWISEMLTNPESLRSLRNIDSLKGLDIHDVDTVKRDIAQCFSEESAVVERPYNEVVLSNNEFDTVLSKLNSLVDRQSATNRTALVEKVELITENLDTLIARIDDDPETYQMSGKNMRTLSELAYVMGREIEFYSIYAYQLRDLVLRVNETVEKLEKAIKRF